MEIWQSIICSILFVLAVIIYVQYIAKNMNRDYDAMQRSSLEHAKWMVDFGRMVEKNEQERRRYYER